MDIDQEAREILCQLRERVESGGGGEIYGDRQKAMRDINILLASPSIENVKLLLAPTANIQELSMENGWGQEFNELADQLERLLGIS